MSDAHTPRTTSRVLQTPRNYRIYTTTREVPTEFPLPTVGAVLSATNFIAGFTNHYVMDVTDYPKGAGKVVTVTHGPVPTQIGGFIEYESVAYTFPPIYPNSTAFFPGGSKPRPRVVPAKVKYEYTLSPITAPTNWMDDPAIWDYESLDSGTFEVKSYLAEAAGATFANGSGDPGVDGNEGSVGDFLNPMFIGQDTINDAFSIYAPGDLYYLVGASSPHATDYAGFVAEKSMLMASRTIHTWYCFYMRRTVFVRAQ